MALNRTFIEWCKNPDGTQGYTWNPITGCLNGCEYCYARKLANTRLKERYLANTNITPIGPITNLTGRNTDPFYPRFWEDKLAQIERPLVPSNMYIQNASMVGMHVLENRHAKRKAKGIFTCDMSDLFGIGIPERWTRQILDAIRVNSVDRFYLLTKQPQNLIKFSPFPDNCYVGVTATNGWQWMEAQHQLLRIEAKVKFVSFEPLLTEVKGGSIPMSKGHWLDWVIIGAQTKPTIMPKIEWVKEIVEAADKAGIPVFLKDNLESLLGDPREHFNLWNHFEPMAPVLRQEQPK